jgi:hypothetical protein
MQTNLSKILKRPGANIRVWTQLAVMPPLPHYPDRSKPFNFDDSKVVDFIVATCRTNRRHAVSLFNQAKQNGVIVFDRDIGQWKGCDWELGDKLDHDILRERISGDE